MSTLLGWYIIHDIMFENKQNKKEARVLDKPVPGSSATGQMSFHDRNPVHIRQASLIQGIQRQQVTPSHKVVAQRRVPPVGNVKWDNKDEINNVRRAIQETAVELEYLQETKNRAFIYHSILPYQPTDEAFYGKTHELTEQFAVSMTEALETSLPDSIQEKLEEGRDYPSAYELAYEAAYPLCRGYFFTRADRIVKEYVAPPEQLKSFCDSFGYQFAYYIAYDYARYYNEHPSDTAKFDYDYKATAYRLAYDYFDKIVYTRTNFNEQENFIRICPPNQLKFILKRIQAKYPAQVFDINLYHQQVPQPTFDTLKGLALDSFRNSLIMKEIKRFKDPSKIDSSPGMDPRRKKDDDPIFLLQQTFRDRVDVNTPVNSPAEAKATNPKYEQQARKNLLDIELYIEKMDSDPDLYSDLSNTFNFIGKRGVYSKGQIVLSDTHSPSVFIHEYLHKSTANAINDGGGQRGSAAFYKHDAKERLYNADHYISVLFPDDSLSKLDPEEQSPLRDKLRFGTIKKTSSSKITKKTVAEESKLWNLYKNRIVVWHNRFANIYYTLLSKKDAESPDAKTQEDIKKAKTLFGLSAPTEARLSPDDYNLVEHAVWQYFTIAQEATKRRRAFAKEVTKDSKKVETAVNAELPSSFLSLLKLNTQSFVPQNIDDQISLLNRLFPV